MDGMDLSKRDGREQLHRDRRVNLNGSYGVYASRELSKFNGNGGSPQAEIFISRYVQNGNPYEGSWDELFANGISSITVSLTVNNATAKGVLTITTDR
jgi:hypothetical protein